MAQVSTNKNPLLILTNFSFCKIRRYVVLMKTHMLTYKDNSGDYSAPTEIIPINNCCTVKSADDELNIKNSFVSPLLIFWQINNFY